MNIQIKCHHCQQVQDFEIYPEINVSKEPALKNMVLNFELFKDTCQNCHQIIPVSYGTIYHDFDQRFLVLLDPNHSKSLTEINKNLLTEYGELDNYMIRVVSNPDDLKEKILLRDAHLDDRLIEIVKQYYVASALEKNPKLELSTVLFSRGITTHEIVFITTDQQKFKADLNEEVMNHLKTLYRQKIEEFTQKGANRIDAHWVSVLFESRH